MKANRLSLNFKLETDQERNDFLKNYLSENQFVNRPPTEEELETMSNYLLWGKDVTTGLNAKQSGLVELESKRKTWDTPNPIESLDGLMETPGFNENVIHPLMSTHYKVKREKFSRYESLNNCPTELRQSFQDLFDRIDRLELMINFYEFAHGKRTNPPREELVNKFTADEQAEYKAAAEKWTQFTYLKSRHLLVELRREQYLLKDMYAQPLLVLSSTAAERLVDIGNDVAVFPLGLCQGDIGGWIFRPWDQMYPEMYAEDTKAKISDYYWSWKNRQKQEKNYLDFTNPEHVHCLLKFYGFVVEGNEKADFDSNLADLLRTIDFYIARADLNDIQREILDLKMQHWKNTDIARRINQKWGKNYTDNYISTVYRQKIIAKICAAAAYHLKLVGNLFFAEEFKTCSRCGRTLMLDEENFMHRQRSKDGFASKCKKCEKETRQSR